MALAIRMLAEPVRYLAAASVAASYRALDQSGAVPATTGAVDHPIRQFFIQNLTDAVLMFSFDGVNDHFPLPGNGFFLSDIMSNKSTNGGAWYLAENDVLYVKQSGVPTTGSVFFSVFYGKDE